MKVLPRLSLKPHRWNSFGPGESLTGLFVLTLHRRNRGIYLEKPPMSDLMLPQLVIVIVAELDRL